MRISRLFIAGLALAAALGRGALASSPSVTLAVPPSMLNGTIVGSTGAAYTPNAQGQITVTNALDVHGFIGAGAIVIPPGATPSTLKLLDGRNANGSALVASSAASGNFLIALTPGTSEGLTGEAATGATKTDSVVFELTLPSTYVAGAALTVSVNANYSGTGTAGTKTVAAAAYLAAAAGTQGSTLVTTAAQTITTTASAYAFTIPAYSGLAPGSRLVIKVTTVMQETGGSSSLTAQINSVSAG